MTAELRRWFVSEVVGPAGPGDAIVALTAAGLSAAAPEPVTAIGFDRAMCEPVPQAADRVEVVLPGYRGKGFVPLLAWLVTARLSGPGTTVGWHVRKQQGPESVHRLLNSLGWRLDRAGPPRAAIADR